MFDLEKIQIWILIFFPSQPSDGFLSRNLHQLVTVGDLDRFYLSISELFHDTISFHIKKLENGMKQMFEK